MVALDRGELSTRAAMTGDRRSPNGVGPTLRAYALAAIAAHVFGAAPPANPTPEGRFLLHRLTAVAPDGRTWATTLPGYRRRPVPADAPLVGLARELGLTEIEVLTVALAAAVEDDGMVGRAIAYVQAPLGGSRPTLGLLAAAFGDLVAGARPIHALLTGAAVASGLLALQNDGAPLPERTVSVPAHLCLALDGDDGGWPGASIGVGSLPEVPLPPSIVGEARRQAAALAGAPGRALALRTGSSAEGRAVAATIAGELGCRPLFVEADRVPGLTPWLLLRRLLPVFRLELAPGERASLTPPPGYRGPILALCGPDGGVEVGGASALDWSLPVPSREERRALWAVALGDPNLAADLARHHRHGSGRIAHLGRLAHQHRALRGSGGEGSAPTVEDVAAAAWTGEGAGLDGLAQPIRDAIPDEALVTPPALRQALDALLLRCRLRDGLAQGLGASITTRYLPGVRALFVGPSGAGKTLAAGWLATRLGLPLYRVDLASVTSKYIGETEKNLAQVLARAEQAEVVLLFDEADSLFGKRTDVKEANDRFANAQTNYLLQRIETFDGVTLLTSNSRTRFDAAFSRRLDAVIDFPLPGPEERRSLWRSHLGAGHRLTQRDLNRLAATADLGGGHIRNAVLAAAVLAHAADGAIEPAHVVQGLEGEYKKLGRQMPIELRAGR